MAEEDLRFKMKEETTEELVNWFGEQSKKHIIRVGGLQGTDRVVIDWREGPEGRASHVAGDNMIDVIRRFRNEMRARERRDPVKMNSPSPGAKPSLP